MFYDSNRIGFGWQAEGPAAGFFPFWIAAGLAIASLINLAQALYDRAALARRRSQRGRPSPASSPC